MGEATVMRWQWLHGEYLLGIFVAVTVLPAVLMWLRSRERRYYEGFGELWPTLLAHIYHKPRGVVRVVLISVGLASLWVALAQPRDGYRSVEWQSEGRNILIAVDVSRSMLARDPAPSRLEWAKREIFDFISLLKGDRIGLIIFAGEAYTHMPLSEDYAMARLFTESLDPSLIGAQGTHLGRAIEVALRSLESAEEGGGSSLKSRDLVIITDGENQGQSTKELARRVRQRGVRIFTVGIGSAAGSPLQMPDGRYLKDAAGQVVISRLDESSLRELANLTGGLYVRSSVGHDGLKKIYEEGILQESPTTKAAREDRIWNELFPWFLLIALCSFVAAFLITPYRPRYSTGGALGLLIMLMLETATSPARAWVRSAVDSSFEEAYELLSSSSNSPEKLQRAEKLLQDLIARTHQNALLHASYYNLFHVYVKKQQWQHAFEALKKAYTFKEDHQPTLDNLKWITDLLQSQQSSHHQHERQNSESAGEKQRPSHSASEPGQGGMQKPSDSAQGGNKNGPQNFAENQQGSYEDARRRPDSHGQQQSGVGQPQGSSLAEEERQQQQRMGAGSGGGEADRKEEEGGAPSAGGSLSAEGSVAEGSVAEGSVAEGSVAEGSQKSSEEETAGQVQKAEEDSEALAPEQALGLFRSLEENHRAYGRKRGPSSQGQQNQEGEQTW